MALFDRNNDRGYYRGDTHRGQEGGGFMDRAQNAARRGWDRLENTFEGQDSHVRGDYENRSTMDYGSRGYNAGGFDRTMDRDGGLNQRNSWADRGWTADAAERTDREWNLGNRGRMDYDRDLNDSATRAGWRAGGMHQDRDRQWNLGGGNRDWGHNWGAGGTHRYDRGYTGGMRGGAGYGMYDRDYNAGGMNRYGADYDRGMGLNRGGVGYDRGDVGYSTRGADYDHGYKTRQQTDMGDPFGDRENHTPIRMTNGAMGRGGMARYDETYRSDNYRNDRGWF